MFHRYLRFQFFSTPPTSLGLAGDRLVDISLVSFFACLICFIDSSPVSLALTGLKVHVWFVPVGWGISAKSSSDEFLYDNTTSLLHWDIERILEWLILTIIQNEFLAFDRRSWLTCPKSLKLSFSISNFSRQTSIRVVTQVYSGEKEYSSNIWFIFSQTRQL